MRILSLDDVKKSITMKEAIKGMEYAFIQLAKQQVQLPLRTGIAIESEDALTLTMPAYLAQDKSLGLKVVSIFPHNLAKQKPSITGCVMLLDAETGEPKALMEASFLTALRTGAISGLATDYFAEETSHRLAIIGSGAQARTQLEAVTTVRDITHISIWSRNSKNANQFASEFQNHYNISVAQSIPMAIRDADIICTATNSTTPFIHFKDVLPHTHINAIGSHSPLMREISNDVLSHAVVIVDQVEAALAESGEIISAIEAHQLERESIIEIGHWLTHKIPSYKNQLTVFKSVGLAIQDISIAALIYQHAVENNVGVSFSLG